MEHRIDDPFDQPVVPVPTPFRNPLAPVAPDPGPILLPIISAAEDFSPGLERKLNAVAIRAQSGDWNARDALYQAFSVKLRRIARSIPVPPNNSQITGTWDADDVWQEGWFVFASIVDRWDAEGSFARYLLAQFPWRLRDAVRAHLRRPATPPRWAVATGVLEAGRIACPLAADREAQVELDCCLQPLTPFDRDLIEIRQADRPDLLETARALKVSERTVSRRLKFLRKEVPRLLMVEPAEETSVMLGREIVNLVVRQEARSESS